MRPDAGRHYFNFQILISFSQFYFMSVTISNGSTYRKFTFVASGNLYSVLVVLGVLNYISVTKETNNPFKTLGKDFKSFDQAMSHYKDPLIKTNLSIIQTSVEGIIQLN